MRKLIHLGDHLILDSKNRLSFFGVRFGMSTQEALTILDDLDIAYDYDNLHDYISIDNTLQRIVLDDQKTGGSIVPEIKFKKGKCNMFCFGLPYNSVLSPTALQFVANTIIMFDSMIRQGEFKGDVSRKGIYYKYENDTIIIELISNDSTMVSIIRKDI